MPALDFNEISPSHLGDRRDDFELFARDFLEMVGFKSEEGPDRGQDGGRDLLVCERRIGPGGSSDIKWLVTCKHKASSGNSVSAAEDLNFRDRLERHQCQGIIAFYSTVPSSGLAANLKALKLSFEVLVYDPERIESSLLGAAKGRTIAARYMPRSFRKWVASSQYAEAPVRTTQAASVDRFFLRQPHISISAALAEAQARNLAVFAIVFDENHSTRSELDYHFGNFMKWEATKRLVDQHFVAALGPSSDSGFCALVPPGVPLEQCRWAVLNGAGHIVDSGYVHGNPSDSYNLVHNLIADSAGSAR